MLDGFPLAVPLIEADFPSVNSMIDIGSLMNSGLSVNFACCEVHLSDIYIYICFFFRIPNHDGEESPNYPPNGHEERLNGG